MLKLGQNTVDLSASKMYLGAELVYESTPIPSGIYDNATAVYSLRKVFTGWDKAVAKIRRSSDSAVKYLFFDGDTVTLSSFVGDSNTTPTATTLGTWLGSDSAFFEEVYSQELSNTIDNSKTVKQTTTSLQPRFALSGVIDLKNGKPFINFSTGNTLLESTSANSSLDDGEEYTLFTVTHNDLAGDLGSFFANNNAASSMNMYSSRNVTVLRIAQYIDTGISAATVNTIAVQDVGDQKLLTTILNSTNLKGYLNNVLQDTDTKTGSYLNTRISLGKRFDSNYLDGGIQEFIIFPSDKTSDLATVHGDINTYYSIY